MAAPISGLSMRHDSTKTIDEYLEGVMSLHSRQHLPLHFEKDPLIPIDVIQNLRSGRVDGDRAFDRVFPERLQLISFVQWSPIEVALTIAAWLKKDMPHARFIDMGSGVGKLCLLLSLISDLRVTGVEQREYLVEIARLIAKRNSIRAQFEHMNCLDVDWSAYDVFYFYNPFQEHVALGEFHLIDDKVDLDRKFHVEYTERVHQELSDMAQGKRLITFHGFGGRIPRTLKLIRSARVGNGKLCMWEKISAAEFQNQREPEGNGTILAASSIAKETAQ